MPDEQAAQISNEFQANMSVAEVVSEPVPGTLLPAVNGRLGIVEVESASVGCLAV